MSWSEVKLLKDRLNAGTRALPKLLIEDSMGNLGGKTITITNGTYTHSIVFPQSESVISIILECLGDWNVSYVLNGATITSTVTVDKVGGVLFSTLKIVSWSDGTDAQIADMVTAADKGLITLSDYWHVGDERTVSLSAMSATGVGESHVAQDVSFVLMNQGGKTLTNAVESGRTECSFIVGMKDCLNEKGYMNSTRTNVGGWTSCARRTWCNNVFKGAIPQTLLPIFKQFQNTTSVGGASSTLTTDNDYFAFVAEIEVYGTIPYAASGEGTLFKYYETSANRLKKVNGSDYTWWNRSPHKSYSDRFCVEGVGSANASFSETSIGIAPFGVI